MERRMLSKSDESTSSKDEVEVRREDQDKINTFSRLHQRELKWEARLARLHKRKEELDDITTDLELAEMEDMGGDDDLDDLDDEDDEDGGKKKVGSGRGNKIPYKIGDVFVHVSVEQAQEMVGKEVEKVDGDIEEVKGKLSGAKGEMDELKVQLYARFGKSINLET